MFSCACICIKDLLSFKFKNGFSYNYDEWSMYKITILVNFFYLTLVG